MAYNSVIFNGDLGTSADRGTVMKRESVLIAVLFRWTNKWLVLIEEFNFDINLVGLFGLVHLVHPITAINSK